MPLGPWRGSEAETGEKAVIEYTDQSRLMRWRLTRRWLTDDEQRAEGLQPGAGIDHLDVDEALD
jgi:hypothetical protein